MHVDDLDNLLSQPWMKQAKELTDRCKRFLLYFLLRHLFHMSGWANIKDEVLTYMARIRAERLTKEYCERLLQRMMAMLPTIMEFKSIQSKTGYSLPVNSAYSFEILSNTFSA